jgi:hypothetical protein
MSEINYFKFFIMYSDDVTADVNYLHVKKIYLVNFSYIIIDDYTGDVPACNHQNSIEL